MNEEILQILEMVKSGTISSEDGEKLISAISESDETKKIEKKGSMFRIAVDGEGSDTDDPLKVRINVPLSIAKHAVNLSKLAPKQVNEELLEEGIDLEAMDIPGLLDMYANGDISEELMDVEVGEVGSRIRVKIYVD